MERAHVVTYWVSGEDGNEPALLSLLSPFSGWSLVDMSGEPVESLQEPPNAAIFEVVASEAAMAIVEADEDHLILWQKKA